MNEAMDRDGGEIRWWQWHLGNRMAKHQHPGEDMEDCSWPECAWHGQRPGEDNLLASYPVPVLRSVALSHLDGLGIAAMGGRFVYERDVIEGDDEDDEEFEYTF
ncbi:MAG: hypothetical protein O3A10_06360 [Chloroflexi bacterium]|nr:hypothetical protein [Chloroflexota bacterium]MDA1145589.1 hypothetical protein [Chloroflexota bacterium]